ncbi:MAG: N-acetylneuraminate synthase [Clostridia bacterium]|nr:N-acetylneuraminate synthase [Clostridia bacterium]
MSKVFIIAEAGVNHNGSMETAKKLVDMAVESGADAVKFQTFKAYEAVGTFAPKAAYQIENTGESGSQYEMAKQLELPFECFREIKAYCDGKGILFISTPDGSESLNYLVSLKVTLIKIGSSDVTNVEFLKEIGHTGLPIILSTGMSTLGEVEEALKIINSTGNTKVRLMHCTTDYPTRIEDVNLRAMVTLRNAFKISVGYSDHTTGIEAAVAAVALGAEFLEKHITLDKNMEGPDHKASMDFAEFRKYIAAVRNAEILLGDGIKRPTKREKEMMNQVRRSIVASTYLEEGTVITKELLAYKRPGIGILPKFADIIIGKRIKRNLEKDEPILWEDVE